MTHLAIEQAQIFRVGRRRFLTERAAWDTQRSLEEAAARAVEPSANVLPVELLTLSTRPSPNHTTP